MQEAPARRVLPLQLLTTQERAREIRQLRRRPTDRVQIMAWPDASPFYVERPPWGGPSRLDFERVREA